LGGDYADQGHACLHVSENTIEEPVTGTLKNVHFNDKLM